MTTDPTNPPLWQAMAEARQGGPVGDDPMLAQMCGHLYAAEIRALADWLVAIWTAKGPPSGIQTEFGEGLSIGMEIHREGTLNILRAEADKAEAGSELLHVAEAVLARWGSVDSSQPPTA